MLVEPSHRIIQLSFRNNS